MTIRFLPAELKDAEILIEMMREMQKDDPWEYPFEEGRLRTNLEQLLREPSCGLAFLALDGEQPVGYLIICFDYSLEDGGKGAWVDEVFVKAERRGEGIGTQLLDLAEVSSRRARATALHLAVSNDNRAKDLYRRCGFLERERKLMTKRLPQ